MSAVSSLHEGGYSKVRDRDLTQLLFVVIFFIVYGSLYPWHFAFRELPANPFWILLHSWSVEFSRRDVADFCVNVALYIPLGMAGYLSFRRRRMAGPVVLGMLLSASIEMTQLFTPGRVCSAVDLVNNTLGSIAGVFCGRVFERLAQPGLQVLGQWKTVDRAALALLFCRAASLLFPMFPVTSLPLLLRQFVLFAHGPWFQAMPFLSATVAWLVTGRLLQAAGVRSAELCLGLSLLLVPAQFIIIDHHPAPVDFLAAISGWLLFVFIGWLRGGALWWAFGFLTLLLTRGLMPLPSMLVHPQEFNWIPFGPLLKMNWQAGMEILLEKTFYYGTAIWMVRATGARWRIATPAVAAMLAAIEAVQMWLPGRTPEITDPLMALLIGGGLYVLSANRVARRRQMVAVSDR